MSEPGAVLETFYTGWANHQRLVLAAIGGLTPEQLAAIKELDMEKLREMFEQRLKELGLPGVFRCTERADALLLFRFALRE